jgi:hypothetical protein
MTTTEALGKQNRQFNRRMMSHSERWEEKYKPIKNHIDTNACNEGTMFETYGAEYKFVMQHPIDRVWTLVDCDGKLYICSGFHFVNRIGYFICEVAHTVEPTQVFYG